MREVRCDGGSVWTLSIDLWSAKILVWLAIVGREATLTRDAHLFFFDRYRRLGGQHRRRGHIVKANRFEQKADEHYRASGEDGPPYAAAMAMPRPRRFVRIDAISKVRFDSPDDAA